MRQPLETGWREREEEGKEFLSVTSYAWGLVVWGGFGWLRRLGLPALPRFGELAHPLEEQRSRLIRGKRRTPALVREAPDAPLGGAQWSFPREVETRPCQLVREARRARRQEIGLSFVGDLQIGGDLLDNLAGCARTAHCADGIQKWAEVLDELGAFYLLLLGHDVALNYRRGGAGALASVCISVYIRSPWTAASSSGRSRRPVGGT